MREHRGGLEHQMARLRQQKRHLTSGEITAMEFIDKNKHSADGIIKLLYFTLSNIFNMCGVRCQLSLGLGVSIETFLNG